MTLEFLSSGSILAEEINYISDEDGNIQLRQGDECINLTPRQCLDLRELLSAHLDVLKFVRDSGE